MRRKIFGFCAGLLFSIGIFAQNDKVVFYDVMVEQNIMLNKWHKDKQLNDPLESMNSTDISGRIHFKLYYAWGIWGSLGFGLRPEGKNIPSDFNRFDNINVNDYHQSESFEKPKSGSASAKAAFGMFYEIQHNKWKFTPYFGLSSDIITDPSLSYTLKSKTSNAAYDVRYEWMDGTFDEYKSMSNLYFQLKTSYKISNRIDLIAGISYRHYTTAPKMSSTLSNRYNGKIIDEIHIEGNKAKTIGISAGISF